LRERVARPKAEPGEGGPYALNMKFAALRKSVRLTPSE
jgi:hypothetical protein